MNDSVVNQTESSSFKRRYYRGKQWLYRGQRAGGVAKVLNRMWAIVASKKAMSNGLVALEVIGRKSGRVVSFPLVRNAAKQVTVRIARSSAMDRLLNGAVV